MSHEGQTDLGPGVLCVVTDHDPTTEAIDCPAASLIIVKNPALANNTFWYRKLDDGPTTNVVLVSGE